MIGPTESGFAFGRPILMIPVTDYEAMQAQAKALRAKVAELESHLGALGYDFVGTTTRLHLLRDPGTSPLSEDEMMIVAVPEIRIRAEYQVSMGQRPRTIREAVQEQMMKREQAIEAAMRHAAHIWVKTFHDRAAQMAAGAKL